MGCGNTFIFDIGVVAVVVSGVGDNLNPSVGKSHSVLARGGVALPHLGVGKILIVLIVDRVAKSVVGRSL